MRFYTGVHDRKVNAFLHECWTRRLAQFKREGIVTFHRTLKYADEDVQLSDGTTKTVHVAREKGIDIRIALDVVRLARHDGFDVALLFSQDQDMSEAVAEVKSISQDLGRWIKLASAYPTGTKNPRGIDGTDWITFDKAVYDRCLDPRDYRPRQSGR